jgi:hypothetical protein
MDEPARRLPVQVIVFPGTDRERDDLLAAIARNCACQPASGTTHPDPCGPHDLLLLEPTLKRLVFYRRFSASLRRGEWLEAPDWTTHHL